MNDTPIRPALLALLRCPVAMQSDRYGNDPGRLTLVRDAWLVCADTQQKYPIHDGIPVMLIEEGRKWLEVPVDRLPVPPPV